MILAAKPKPISRQGRCRDDQLPPFESPIAYQQIRHANNPTLGGSPANTPKTCHTLTVPH
jgi:hypothetical protein